MSTLDATVNQVDDLDDIRYEHHLKHRGRSNHRMFFILWGLVAGYIALRCASRTYRWWRRRMSVATLRK
jgi:hypothetical protein